jgi:hypothetical protein
MSFTVTVEDGTGVSGANCYASVADANTFFDGQIYKDAWISASASAKGQALAMATSTLDTVVTWDGTKADRTNAREWPRNGVTDKNGFSVANNIIPVFLKEATYLTAMALLEDNRREEYGDAGIDELTIEGINLKFNKTDRASILPHYVMMIIEDFGRVRGGKFASVVRA